MEGLVVMCITYGSHLLLPPKIVLTNSAIKRLELLSGMQYLNYAVLLWSI
jgi:hypothetical protein